MYINSLWLGNSPFITYCFKFKFSSHNRHYIHLSQGIIQNDSYDFLSETVSTNVSKSESEKWGKIIFQKVFPPTHV